MSAPDEAALIEAMARNRAERDCRLHPGAWRDYIAEVEPYIAAIRPLLARTGGQS